MGKGSEDSMCKGPEARKDSTLGELHESKWPAPASACQDANLDSTLRLASLRVAWGG